MDRQLTFFDAELARDQEVKRLGGQCAKILERLRRGRVSNDELSRISRKYTSRISDLRQAGHDVRCVSHDRATGLAFYELYEK